MLGRVMTMCVFVFVVSLPYFCHEVYMVGAAGREVMLVSVTGCVRSTGQLFVTSFPPRD